MHERRAQTPLPDHGGPRRDKAYKDESTAITLNSEAPINERWGRQIHSMERHRANMLRTQHHRKNEYDMRHERYRERLNRTKVTWYREYARASNNPTGTRIAREYLGDLRRRKKRYVSPLCRTPEEQEYHAKSSYRAHAEKNRHKRSPPRSYSRIPASTNYRMSSLAYLRNQTSIRHAPPHAQRGDYIPGRLRAPLARRDDEPRRVRWAQGYDSVTKERGAREDGVIRGHKYDGDSHRAPEVGRTARNRTYDFDDDIRPNVSRYAPEVGRTAWNRTYDADDGIRPNVGSFAPEVGRTARKRTYDVDDEIRPNVRIIEDEISSAS